MSTVATSRSMRSSFRSAASAIAWEFGARHRWGLTVILAYLIALTSYRIFGDAGAQISLDNTGAPEISEKFAFTVVVPLTSSFVYLLAVFSYGLSGDLAARQSIFPHRLFTLPLSNSMLTAIPMLCGALTMMSLWLAAAVFGLRPGGVPAPLIWPALFAAAFLMWAQALMWLPYPLRGMRVIVAVLWMSTIDAVVLLALHFRVSDLMMIAIMAPQIPLAYVVARHAVARSRRGDVPDWLTMWRSAAIRGYTARSSGRLSDFPSARHAQVWFEWRQQGLVLPALVAMLLPFELAMLFLGDSSKLVFYTLLGVLLTPPVMAAFVTARNANKLTPFNATRPMTTAALMAAKLKAMAWSALGAWLLVLSAVPIALMLSDKWLVVSAWPGKLSNVIGEVRAILLAALVFGGLLLSTWKQLVKSMYVGLSGRDWLMKANGAWIVTVLVFIGPLGTWIHDSRELRTALWDGIPLILAGLVLIKMAAACWIARRLVQSRLLSDRALIRAAGGWALVVLALHGVFLWFMSSPHIPPHVLTMLAILLIPLARVSAAPLALAGNRHR